MIDKKLKRSKIEIWEEKLTKRKLKDQWVFLVKSTLTFYDTGEVDSNGNKIWIALNPLKRMIQGKPYKSEIGQKVMGQEAVRYATFLNKLAQKKQKKEKGENN